MKSYSEPPKEGYGEAIVLPKIKADHFEIKTNFLQLVQANPFYGLESENPHAHINSFKRITSTLRFRNVLNDVIKHMMFPYSLEGAAKTWYLREEETPNSILTWGRISVTKFLKRLRNLALLVVVPILGIIVRLPITIMLSLGLLRIQLSTSGTLSSNTIPNPKGEMKAITTRSGVAYEGPSIPTNPSPKKVVETETKEATDKEQTKFQGSTAQIPPPVIPISIPEPDVPKTLPKTTYIPEPDVPKSLPKPNIPYPSHRDDQKSREKASNQIEKIFQIFQDLRFDISFADALLLMPRFAPTIKSLLMNKEKLLELAKIPLNENCSAMLLKKASEKLRKSRQVSYYHVISLDGSDPRVPFILGRSFLRTGRALIDVYGEEITLRVDNEAVTFNLDQTTRYSSTNDKSVNRIDIIDAVCEEYAPELLGFSNSSGGNPTSTSEPFTSEFILEEIEAYLKDDSISPKIDHAIDDRG
ncbi:hypothetical protein Tco_1057066 [Tanacetum coccineum]|uniref:Reverse transcriptase domain-containing protein n=1 Tax=Tanacetum coccineum TaxID=301880 RepID=A0ABQ5H5Q3_9ASTR